MTKKDYEAFADLFRFAKDAKWDANTRHELELGAAYIFEKDNPRFDRARFLAACRGEDATDSAGRKVRYSRRDCSDSHGRGQHYCDECDPEIQEFDRQIKRAR